MSRYQVVFLLFIIATLFNGGYTKKCKPPKHGSTPICPRNEVFKPCGSPCQKTCVTQNDNCTKLSPNGCKYVNGCYCKENYIRLCSEYGECRPKKECLTVRCAETTTQKICPKNEHFEECGSPCQVYCATINVKCTRVNVACTNTCYCNKGYVRRCNESDICIPINECSERCCPCEKPTFD